MIDGNIETGNKLTSVNLIAYEQGRYACRECKGPNPYPVDSEAFRAWNRGWNDQLEGRKAE